MFAAVIRIADTLLYIFKFFSYTLIAFYLYFQMKVGQLPHNSKVQDFLDWSDGVLLPFLMAAAACEAIHIFLRPILKWVKLKEEDEIRNILNS
ncbi:hypothetical protein QF049_001039 [Paenibacillus sp. W4I10]|uniref:hypothetical protein n=1 Tax=Paenibacillus sp. W4I10 TaxID=3042298 RepID=UPI00277EFBFC|nr:hypothetical protein [Paenibacillus sp. W4I10]MDQ0719778.1 hypothetical protein [Paenibacillus sp. W4I10]